MCYFLKVLCFWHFISVFLEVLSAFLYFSASILFQPSLAWIASSGISCTLDVLTFSQPVSSNDPFHFHFECFKYKNLNNFSFQFILKKISFMYVCKRVCLSLCAYIHVEGRRGHRITCFRVTDKWLTWVLATKFRPSVLWAVFPVSPLSHSWCHLIVSWYHWLLWKGSCQFLCYTLNAMVPGLYLLSWKPLDFFFWQFYYHMLIDCFLSVSWRFLRSKNL